MDRSWIRQFSVNLVCGDAWSHAAVTVVFGAVLGLGFNSANPNGIAWRPPAPRTVSEDASRPAAVDSGDANLDSATLNPVGSPSSAPVDCMRWEQLAPRVSQSKALAVDLRPAAAYETGHVPKSVSYPLDVFGDDLDSPAWQTFRSHVNVHHFVVLYGADQPTDAMRRFRTRLVDELGYAMVMFAEDGFRGWETRLASRKMRIADAESKARIRMEAHSAATDRAVQQQPTPQQPARPKVAPRADATPQAVVPATVVPAVTHAQAAALPDALWIDSRSRAAFDAAHIPGAISIPESSAKAVLERLRAEQPAERPIVVYCSGVGCGTSRRLATKLAREFGFTRVHHLPGGFTEWQQIQAAKAAAEENLP